MLPSIMMVPNVKELLELSIHSRISTTTFVPITPHTCFVPSTAEIRGWNASKEDKTILLLPF